MNKSYEIIPLVKLLSPLGETLNHAINTSGTWSIATSRNGNMALFNIDQEQFLLSNDSDCGDIWGVVLSARDLKALTVAAPDRFFSPNPDHWYLGLWDIRNGDQISRFEIEPGCYKIAASSDLQIAMGAHRGKISWWYPDEHKCIGSVASPHSQDVWLLAISENGSVGASTSLQEAFLWDIDAKKPIKSINLPKSCQDDDFIPAKADEMVQFANNC